MRRISPEKFIIKEVATLNPLGLEYRNYWRGFKKKCIEGEWIEGVWIPGNLWFYLNACVIELNKTRNSKTKVIGRPLFYDYLLEVSWLWAEARGLTGFEKQPEVIAYKDFLENEIWDEDKDALLRSKIPDVRKVLAETKENLGKPLYLNDAQDFMWLTARDTGKSFYTANAVILHEFLFDGAKEYNLEENKKLKTSITVGAGSSDYSNKLLDKVQLSLINLPGSIELNGKFYPSPLSKQYSGSWTVGKALKQEYQKKIGGTWQKKGSGTQIRHITYKDNPFAAQGSRNSIIVKEECGHFDNLLETHGPDQFTMSDSGKKFGSSFYLGTGGAFLKGGLTGAKKMFYAPDEYQLLSIDDKWENKGKIGYFTETIYAKRSYKDIEGYTNYELGLAQEYKEREKIKKGADAASRLAEYIQYNPIIPSEVFLSTASNIFPVAEAMEVLSNLETHQNYLNYETVIDIYFDANSSTGVSYKVDLEKKLQPIVDFPLKDLQSREGAVIMYEAPLTINGKVPDDMYLIGHDPVANDNPDGPSLSATYILKNKKYFSTHGGDEIVAEYISRPEIGRSKTNETLEKLWMMYGSPTRGIWFENAVGNTKEYFEKRKKLIALCTQPETILSKTGAYTAAGTIVYGYPMSNKKIKKEAELYLRDWLLEERGKQENGKVIRNIDLIKSRFLLKQIISYDSDGNFDAVLGYMGCIIGLEETFNQYYKEVETNPVVEFLLNNKIYFKGKKKDNNKPQFNNIFDELDYIKCRKH
jgi:hypothetical protein